MQAREGSITERTAWLIEHHMEAPEQLRTGDARHPGGSRLRRSGRYDDLMLLERTRPPRPRPEA